MCGEKIPVLCPSLHPPGSPPRVRGKAEPTHRRQDPPRITPACAGKRSEGLAKLLEEKDHPRVCGEKGWGNGYGFGGGGSPPRVRGKASLSFVLSRSNRITPACAGKSELPERKSTCE